MTSHVAIRTGDGRIHCTISAGQGAHILFLNGAFSTGRAWKRVLRALSPGFHTVTFDARGRGRSSESPDYSFSGALDDVGRVIEAARLQRPILVGWSHGATLALRYAAAHPGEVAGVLLIDGAFPIHIFHEAARKRIRKQYRLLRVPMHVLGRLRVLSRMSHHQAANVVIELDEIDAGLLPDYRGLTCPALFIVGTGPNPGSPAAEMATMRAATELATAVNPLVKVHATVNSNHLQILRRDASTVAEAIEILAAS